MTSVSVGHILRVKFKLKIFGFCGDPPDELSNGRSGRRRESSWRENKEKVSRREEEQRESRFWGEK